MILKSLFAAAAVATALTVAIPAPEAKADIDVDIGIGVGGYFPGYYRNDYVYDYGYGGGYGHGYGDGYGHAYRPHRDVISCNRGRKIVDRSGFNRVRAVDCDLPGYRYTAWKNGRQFMVRMNGRGDITNVRRIH
jgi:hypothetical protein